MNKLLRIATRKSPLALWQANSIKNELLALYPSLRIDLIGITTSGDKNLSSSLAAIGGKGLFVKELEQALLENKADIAVHSMKDVPMELPEGLALFTICKRDDPRDVLITLTHQHFMELPAGSVIGTSSLRRLCQLKALRPDLVIKPLRGNVDTRLQRLSERKYDAIVLAAAGLKRLGLANHISEFFTISQILPAVGQGALGIECRSNDREIEEIIGKLNDPMTHVCVAAERALNQSLDGGCQVPIAGYATLEKDIMTLRGLVGSLDGQTILKSEITGEAAGALSLGRQLAQQLLDLGAKKILTDFKHPDTGFLS